MNLITKFLKNLFSNLKDEIVMEQPEVKPTTFKKNRAIKKNTKHQQVKKHLIEKGWIDSWTAIELFGATRLSAIIFNLRKEGYDIISVPQSSYDRNQELCNFTTYKYNYNNGVN
jgi:hypothetical protein